ncbi:radial spoke head 10 homolog B [Aplochiton taeniatus]
MIDAELGPETDLMTTSFSSQPPPTEKKLERSCDVNEFRETPPLSNIIVQRYEGEKYKEQFHGEGVVYFQGGNVYKGMFSEGVMQGHGVYTWSDGTKYEGQFNSNVPSGHGTYTWTDGSCYKGEVYYGIRHGFGTYTFADAYISYRGQWHHGKKHGKGTIYYNKDETSWYDGDWVDNIREGRGTRCYLSGNMYEGEWKKNQRHGEGRMKWLELGQHYSGTWENGVQHGQGSHTWFLKRVSGSQYPLRNEYRGRFVQGQRHGEGSFYYASGAVYKGEWKNNKKHGPGKFVFKNGRVFEGEFVDDHMEEFPSFCLDGSKSPDLSGIRTHTPCQTHTFVEFAVLRHIAELRSIYSFYSSLGHGQSPDNTFLLSRLQFWRLLKDCGVHHHGVTLAQIDRFVSEDVSPEEVHSPFSTMLLRRFLSCIVTLAYYTYHKEIESPNNVLVACFTKLMMDNIIPHAKHVKGRLFSNRLRGTVAVNYIERCWEIYRAFCRPSPAPLCDHTMTCRHFVWMCKDLVLVDAELTSGKVLEVILGENGATPELSSSMDSRSSDTGERHEEDSVAVATASPVSMLEAKLSNQTLCPPSTEPAEERGMEGKPAGPEASLESELDLWIQRTHQFFTKTFFPAFEYNLLLKREMEEGRLREEAWSRIALAKATEAARLREQWEAEEEERRREEEEDEEVDRADGQEEDGNTSPVFQTPVASATSVVGGAKQPPTTAAKKKKK